MKGGFIIMETPETIRATLAQAYGTTQYWKIYPDLLISDGVKLMAEMCNAYWLLQDAFIWLHSNSLKGEELIVLKLILDEHSSLLSIEDGNYNVLAKQDIPFIDFLLQEGITIYWCDNVLMLPTEY